mmetsp:Transcript_11493/g.16394  ORF Transcript_11493/g.16394 Transcript_11493/m.16394 type:complete len:153 (-) Transcript_11493:1864-2322(-)
MNAAKRLELLDLPEVCLQGKLRRIMCQDRWHTHGICWLHPHIHDLPRWIPNDKMLLRLNLTTRLEQLRLRRIVVQCLLVKSQRMVVHYHQWQWKNRGLTMWTVVAMRFVGFCGISVILFAKELEYRNISVLLSNDDFVDVSVSDQSVRTQRT